MKNTRSVQPSAALSCLGFMICWTIAPLFIKALTGYVDAWTQNFLRYCVSFVFWMPFLIYTGLRGGLPRRLFARALLPVAFNVATQSSYAAAFYYADPGFITLVTMTLVFWVALFSMAMFPQERRLLSNAAFWAGVALSGIGVCGVVMFHPQFSARATLIGALLAAGMAFGWGCYTISVKRLLGDVDSRVSFSIITVYTVIGHGILAFVMGRPGECLKMDAVRWSYVVISALAGIAIGHTLYYSAIRRIGASIPTMFLLLRPFTVLLLSALLFGERLTIPQWLFGCLLVIGSAFFVLAQRQRKVQIAPAPLEVQD